MKKKILALTMTAAMAATMLAGCGGNNNSSSASTSSAASTSTASESSAASTSTASESSAASTSTASVEATDVELTVWTPQEDQDEGWLDKVLENFQAEHPEWNITFTTGVCSEGDAKTNMADASAGADVFMYANDQIPDLLTAGALSEFVGDNLDTIKSMNSDTTVATVTYEDSVYGVPFTGNTWFMYYNKQIFSDEDVANLDTMLEKGKVAFPLNNSWYFASFYAANGCTLFGESGSDEAAGIQLAGDAGTAVTKYLVNLVKNENFVNDSDGVGISGLTDGSIGAMFSGTWDYNNVVEAIGEDNVGICAAPTVTIDGKDCQMKAFAGTKAIGVNQNTKYPEAATALALYMGGSEAQKLHYEMRNIIPTDTSFDAGDDALAKAQMDAMDYASIVQPVLSAMGNYWTPATAMADEILQGVVTEDNAAEKTETMNEQMNTSAVE